MNITIRRFFLCLIVGLAGGVYLWKRSTFPPYGTPSNELSNVYWGLIIDVAHKWRSGHLTFWDEGLGGVSLFTSGSYPVLFPTNIAALFLNDAQFYLFKLIEPYVFGLTLTIFLFVHHFRIRWPLAIAGALIYMGLNIGRQGNLVLTPIMISGVVMMPLALSVFLSWEKRNIYLALFLMSATTGLQFLMGGAGQFLQTIYWEVLFIIVYVLLNYPIKRALWLSVVSMGILSLGAISSAAVQILPTIHNVLFEAARYEGAYPVNSFPLWPTQGNFEMSLFKMIAATFVFSSVKSAVTFLMLLIIALIFAIGCYREIFKDVRERKLFFAIVASILLYFSSPSIFDTLLRYFPHQMPFLNLFSKISFIYGVYYMDFLLVLIVVVVFSRMTHGLDGWGFFRRKKSLSVLLVLAGCLWVVVAAWIMNVQSGTPFLLERFKIFGHKFFWGLALTYWLIVVFFMLGPRIHKFMRWVCCLALFGFLISLGVRSFWMSFMWNDKGLCTSKEQFGMSSPEYNFYKNASGKFFLPFSYYLPVYDNYNLLYGVKGLTGFIPIPSKHFNDFIFYLNHFSPEHSRIIRNYWIERPTEAMTNFWPVDFSWVDHHKVLPWRNFKKLIDGDRFDIWGREGEPIRVFFKDGSSTRTIQEVAEDLNKGVNIYPRTNDVYRNYVEQGSDDVVFNVQATDSKMVVLPKSFHSGWRAYVNGQQSPVVLSDHIFMGVVVPKGASEVHFKFTPPWLMAGFFITVLFFFTLFVLLALFV